jgi:4-amino-4-deoxy-L-arabinose transferase-like glycosyltransferase
MSISTTQIAPLEHAAPLRSRAAEEGAIDIPTWSVPLALILLYVCLFSGLSAIGLVGPDEPRYAAIARAMMQTHDWITPRLWGTPWFEKPVLYYWAAGFAMRIFGVGEFAARLPSALAAMIACLAMTWTALRCYGMGTAWYTLLMLPTSVAMIGFARGAGPDMLFAGMLTAAMAVAVEMLLVERPSQFMRIAFGFFLGATVLAKGPAGIILAGGATLLWGIISRRWWDPLRFLHPVVIAVFCVTALPWYVICALRNPVFIRTFIWEHNFQRYLTRVFEHTQPFWYYAPITLLGVLPWLPLFILQITDLKQSRRAEAFQNSPSLFVGCWACFTLLFFSLSQSKLPGYILPAIPALILLVARSTSKAVEQQRPSLRPIVISAGLMFPVALAIVNLKFRFGFAPGTRLDFNPYSGLRIGFIATCVCGVLILWYGLKRRLDRAIVCAACTVAILIILANRLFLPMLDYSVSARTAAKYLLDQHRLDYEQKTVAVVGLPRAFAYGLNYYFERDLPTWTFESVGNGVVYTTPETIPELQRIADIQVGNVASVTLDGKVVATQVTLRAPTGK